ncbi:SrfA family protein [Reyranella sp.]|uniref:SrfA family protein n=1 Tax=Reyranella sp. TaxID=1929291 RepID=UPI003F70A977
MTAGPLLVSEPLQRYRALGLAGDPVWRAAGQLRAAIAARLSREHADLLALPEAEPSGRSINWYAPFDGEVKRLGDLDDAERREILDRVQRLHGEIAGLATQMEAVDRSNAERNFARLLRHSLTAPGEETLYVVDGRPVMAFWGFTADAALPGVFLNSPPPAVAPRVAAPLVARPEAVMASAPAIAAVAAPRTVWWQWLLLGVLLMLILALLAWLVRPYLPRLEPYIEAEARERALSFAVRQPMELQQTRVSTLVQDNESLRLELARLTDELSRRGGDCAAGVLGPGGVIVGSVGGPPIERGAGPDAAGAINDPNKDASKELDKQQEAMGPNGKDTKGLDEQNKDKNTASKNDPKKDEPKPMVVPPESKQKQDLAFLKGDWRSRTGLATATGEKDIRPSYTLDDKGKGKVSFTQKNGATCEAPAEARWDGTKLVIEEKSNPRCSDGKTYARNTVNCEIGADGAAQCKGSQPGDPRSYKVQIGR